MQKKNLFLFLWIFHICISFPIESFFVKWEVGECYTKDEAIRFVSGGEGRGGQKFSFSDERVTRLGVGLYLLPCLSVDCTANYRGKASLRKLSSLALGSSHRDSSISALSYLTSFHLYLDSCFSCPMIISPYISGGVGMSYLKLNDIVQYGDGVSDQVVGKRRRNLAWNVGCGLSAPIPFCGSVTGQVGYRYLDQGHAVARRGIIMEPSSTLVGKLAYRLHELYLSLLYFF